MKSSLVRTCRRSQAVTLSPLLLTRMTQRIRLTSQLRSLCMTRLVSVITSMSSLTRLRLVAGNGMHLPVVRSLRILQTLPIPVKLRVMSFSPMVRLPLMQRPVSWIPRARPRRLFTSTMPTPNMAINIDFGDSITTDGGTGLGGVTQFDASSSVSDIRQNGYASGCACRCER